MATSTPTPKPTPSARRTRAPAKSIKPAKSATPVAAPTANQPKAKPTAKKASVTPAPTPKAAPIPKAAPAGIEVKNDKPRKPKLVRDSFTIPKTEYAAIDGLKERSAKLGRSMKKSELLRAGLMALAAMSDAQLQKTIAAVPAIKTGRPKA